MPNITKKKNKSAAKRVQKPKQSAAPAKKGGKTGGAGFNRVARTVPPAGVVVEQDEFITNVLGSVDFAVAPLAINPGLAATFPWLSQQAALYEKYTVMSLEFYYAPMVSGFAAGGQTGKVMLMCDYDALDGEPATKRSVEAAYLHADGMPYETIRMRVDPAEANDRAGRHGKYIRSGVPPSGSDIRLYDAGNLYVCTEGQSSAAVVGELRVRYKLRLSVAQLIDVPLANNYGPVARWQPSTPIGLASNVDAQIPLATTVYNGVRAVADAFDNWVLPVGRYLLHGASEMESNTGGLTTSVLSLVKRSPAGVHTSLETQTSVQPASVRIAHTLNHHYISDGIHAVSLRARVVGSGTLSVNSAALVATKY